MNPSFFWERPQTRGFNGNGNGPTNPRSGYNEKPPEKDGTDCWCHSKAIGGTLSCASCDKKFHIVCVAKSMRYNAIEKCMWKNYLCGVCRIFKMDPFTTVVHQVTTPIALDSRRMQNRAMHVTFSLPDDLRGYMVQIRSIYLDGNIYTGPAWPYTVDAFVNSKRAFRVEPPKYLHNRREQNYDISNTIQAGKTNDLELNVVFDKKQSESPDAPKVFFIGLFVVKAVPESELLAQVRRRPSAPQDRYKRVLAKLQAKPEDEVACVSHAAGRTMSFVDPVSHCRIETPCIGTRCVHLQTFDLESYIHVNSQTRSLSSRWHCPVCNAVTLPEDLIIDSFMSRILSEQQGLGKVVIKDCGGWEVVLDDQVDVCNLDDSDSEGPPQQRQRQQQGEQHQQQREDSDQQRSEQPSANKLPVHALPRKAAAAPYTNAKATPTPMRRDITEDYHRRPPPYDEPSPKQARTGNAEEVVDLIDSD